MKTTTTGAFKQTTGHPPGNRGRHRGMTLTLCMFGSPCQAAPFFPCESQTMPFHRCEARHTLEWRFPDRSGYSGTGRCPGARGQTGLQ